MTLAFIKTFFKWILRFFGVEFIEPPSDDLEEKAKFELDEKIEKIRSRRSNHEVDSKPFECDTVEGPASVGSYESAYDIQIPNSVDSFIEFHSNEVIQARPELIFAGTFLKQKKVAIKKVGSDDVQLEKEMIIADQLKHHENFLVHLFGFRQLGECYIATEAYDATLLCLVDHPTFHCETDFRNVLMQLCNGLEFLHDSGIAHRCLDMRNIVVVMRKKSPIFKITNFRDAMRTTRENFFKTDVKDLGNILDNLKALQNLQKSQVSTMSTSDSILFYDIIDIMTNEDYRDRPSIAQVKAHPFLWTPHETLHFIVQLAKLLESKNTPTAYDALKKISPQVLANNDWRSCIDRYVLDELKAINSGTFPKCGIIKLVKTIRNLVRNHFSS